jgi:hypothetical protein
MTEDFRQKRISDLAASLVAAAGPNRKTQRTNTKPTTAAAVAASFAFSRDDDGEDVQELSPEGKAELVRQMLGGK